MLISTTPTTSTLARVRNVSENHYPQDLTNQMLGDILDALKEKIEYKDHKDLYTDVAQRLSKLAGKSPPWGWRYIQSVYSQTVAPSKSFVRAVQTMTATLDDMPAIVAQSETVTIYAKQGTIPAGSYVMGEARRCANPECTVTFVPSVPWRRYCPKCRPPKEKNNE